MSKKKKAMVKITGPECGIPLQTCLSIAENTFFTTYSTEPLLGVIGSRISKRPDYNHPTAYVAIDKNEVEIFLGYNPYWLASLKNDTERRGIIRHEYYHVLFKHLTRRGTRDRKLSAIFNIATDLAVNSLIGKEEIPRDLLFPGVFPKHCEDKGLGNLIAGFPVMKNTEWYFEKLLEASNIEEEVFTLCDNHEGWGKISEDLSDIIENEINNMVQEGIRKAEEKGNWGSIPSEMREYIKKLYSKEVDWKTIVKMFFARTRSQKRTSSMKKLNRKVPYLFPGVKRGTIANFLFAIDQSGSMSNKEVQVGMGELLSLSKEASIDSINFDTEVDLNSLLTWKHGKDHDWVRTRQGGTDVNCVAKYLSKEGVKNKYSGCIIYTDGYTPDLQAIPRVKVLWLITENGTRNPVRPGDLCVQIKHEKKPSK